MMYTFGYKFWVVDSVFVTIRDILIYYIICLRFTLHLLSQVEAPLELEHFKIRQQQKMNIN